MEPKNKNTILISCLVIFVLVTLCLCVIVTIGIGVSLLWPVNFGGEQPTETLSPDANDNLPQSTLKIVLEIEDQVSADRGLNLLSPVPRTLMTQEELEKIVVEEFFAEYTDEDARQDVLVLSLLGLLPADFDLRNFYNALYSEQIAGFYDRDTGKIYILKGQSFGGSEKSTYAHEFTHVLQDQHFKFDEGLHYNDESCELDSERCAAIQALIEGDASYTEMLWFKSHANLLDYRDLMKDYDEYSSPVFDSAPPFMALDLYFPYEYGYSFVEYLYDMGGFAAVDEAYDDIPLSTEQIMHPERYPWDKPIKVDLDTFDVKLGSGWSLLDQNIMGEWFTYLILSQAYDPSYRLPEDQGQTAAAGWGGDAYAIYLHEETDEIIFVMDSVWDTPLDADEFVSGVTQYANLRWQPSPSNVESQATWSGQDGNITIIQDGSRVIWVIAPNEELLDTVLVELR